ncbi:MAG: helix-turn-helix transcriptional regulator [Ruminococcaceae bacterium]|nr:helix-turn-helix transcriptional regulator [Oscillospiraceae bacterium]
MSIFSKKKNNSNEEPMQETVNEPVIEEFENANTIGSRIAQGRKAKGYTQEEFSQLLDVTAQAVSKWENDISCPDIQLLPKIAEIIDMTTDELLTGKKTEKKKEIQKVNIDTSNLKININVLKPGQNPVNVSLPLSMVKRFAKIGNGISGIMGNGAIDGVKLDEILTLVENGATGEILNVVADDNTNVKISIE